MSGHGAFILLGLHSAVCMTFHNSQVLSVMPTGLPGAGGSEHQEDILTEAVTYQECACTACDI